MTQSQQAAPLADMGQKDLPEIITEQVQKKGDLIDISNFSEAQIEEVRKIVADFDINDTAKILTFAAKPQLALSKFLDELLVDIKAKDAGVAGDISLMLAEGIDLMALHKVKDQLKSGTSNSFLAKVWRFVSRWKNYIEAFYHSQKPVRDLIDKIERLANNRIQALTRSSEKLDRLANQSGVQVEQLKVWIAAGEAILLQAIQDYNAKRPAVLESKDPLEASQLRDMARQIASFEKRLLEAKIAYVEAGSVTIPRVRAVQEAVRIEIQNISEQILFQIPKFKAAIVQIAALKDVKDAQAQRKIMNENERKLDGVLDDAIAETYRTAKESQGDPLAKVQQLEITINAIQQGIQEGLEMEETTRDQRRQAEEMLVRMKDIVTDALKEADLESLAD